MQKLSKGIGDELAQFIARPNNKVGTQLIYKYGTRHDFRGALCVFNKLDEANHVNEASVVAMMKTNKICGQIQHTLFIWKKLDHYKITPSVDILISTLIACSSVASPDALKIGKNIHSVYTSKLAQIGSYLISMYVKCGKPTDAINLWNQLKSNSSFEKSPVVCTSALKACAQVGSAEALATGESIHHLVRSGVLSTDIQQYTAILNMYVKCNRPESALEVWKEILHSKLAITSHITYVGILTACAAIGTPQALAVGKEIHSITSSLQWFFPPLVNSLINMYLKCREPRLALEVWHNSIAHIQNLTLELATSVLNVCANVGSCALQEGILVHQKLGKSITDCDSSYQFALLNMYSKCGQPNKALQIWDALNNSQITANFSPVLLNSVLTACAIAQTPKSLVIGTSIHSFIVASNQPNIVLYTSLIKMYTRCDQPEKALTVWEEIKKKKLAVGEITCICALAACRAVGPPALLIGEQIHVQVTGSNMFIDTNLGNSLISMYSKCGQPYKALELWKELYAGGFQPSTGTYICVLAICADIGPSALFDGTHIHSLLRDDELQQTDTILALSNFYVKCGQPEKALSFLHLWKTTANKDNVSPLSLTVVFAACAALRSGGALEVGKAAHILLDSMDVKTSNFIVYTSLINMYAKCGASETALSLWHEMLTAHPLVGEKTETVRIISVLSLCGTLRNNAALLVGKNIHNIVAKSTELNRDIVILTSLISMYERCGRADEALVLWANIKAEKLVPTVVTYPIDTCNNY